MIWNFYSPKVNEDCLNTVVMLLWFKMWRAWVSSFESSEHSSVWRGKVHICMSPCLALHFCFLAWNALLSPTALRLCWWMSYNSACVLQIDSQQGLYLPLKALNFNIFSVHDVARTSFSLAVRLMRYIPLNKVCSPHFTYSNPITSQCQEQRSSIPIKSY